MITRNTTTTQEADMASKVIRNEITDGVIYIEVEHSTYDSFTRSVSPAMTRAWRRWEPHMQRQTTQRQRYFGIAKSATDDEVCYSIAVFAPSRERATLEGYTPSWEVPA